MSAGFAAVFAVRSDEIGTLSLTYGGYFLAICVATHFFLRVALPNADPYLFPLCAVLAAVGLVMLYRIEESLAVEQATFFLLGLAAFAATIVFLRDYHVLERYRYLIAVGSIALLLAPRLPGIGSQVNGAFLAIDLGVFTFQPAELGKIGIVIFLASYLNETREVLSVAARRVMGLTIPPLKHFGPLLVVWGAAMVMLVFIRDLGSSLMFFGAFLALVYVATNRLSYVLVGLVLFLAGAWFFAGTVGHVQDRVDIWIDPFANERARRGRPDHIGALHPGRGGPVRPGDRASPYSSCQDRSRPALRRATARSSRPAGRSCPSRTRTSSSP